MDKDIQELERSLKRLREEHQALLALIARRRNALRRMDLLELESLSVLETERVRAIGEIERQRREAVRKITVALEPGSNMPMKLSILADRVGEPARGRLLMLRSELHDLIEQCRRENGVTKRATESLLHHVRGVMQVVARAVNHSGTYGRRGVVQRPELATSVLSVTG